MRRLQKYAVVGLTAAFLLILLAGCTELEREGFSPIPQNSPGSWELQPYCDLHN